MDFNWGEIWSTIMEWVTSTGIKIVISLVVLLISFKIINALSAGFQKKAEANKKVDKTLTSTLLYAGKIILKCLVVICIIGYLGIDTSGLAALIASLGVCVGLAVNGTLSNLAGGVLLLLTRPFNVDDFIEAAGYTGTVEELRIVSTKIRTLDNKVVYIPNGTLSTTTIVNYSEKDLRRVDYDFAISYSSDFEKAERIVLDTAAAHELVLDDPAPFVRVSKHDSSSITLTMRVWTKNENYWTVYFDMLESVKKAFDANGIEIPFDQLDVHVKNEK